MKKYLFSLFLSLALFSSCSDDGGNVINHDADNFSAPYLPQGTHTVGARFDANFLDQYKGRELREIHFYMVNVPSNTVIYVFGEGSNTDPGNLIMSVDVGTNLASQSWNVYILENPIEITGEDLWICLDVTHDINLNTIGCDPGPAVTDGDWIRPDGTNVFETFREFTLGESSINWNIRGILNEN